MMKLFSAMMLAVLFVVVVGALDASAAQRNKPMNAKDYLDGLSTAVEKMGSYEMCYTMIIGVAENATSIPGTCNVSGERYKLVLGDREIYGDATDRCTVSHADLEVIYENIDTSKLPIILANPVRAFTSLDKSFTSELLGVSGGVVSLRLVPRRKGSNLLVSSEMKLSSETLLPLSIRYLTEEDVVTIEMNSIEKSSVAIPAIDAIVVPNDYEVVDIR